MYYKPSLRTVTGLAATLTVSLALAAAAAADVGITINGSNVNVRPEPIIQGGRVFVPLRGVFQDLGASVVYDDGQINATGNGNVISLHIGSTQATVNNNPETIDVAPFIVGESTYVPLRFISEALGASVSWDESEQLVAISMSGAPQNDDATQSAMQYDAGVDYNVNEAPPPIPDYTPPPAPDQNDIWQPGYWGWGNAGYYWVPGVWVAPPHIGYLWTPGFWAWNNGLYGFHAGYWSTRVGFYGGINYGAGYYGNGYAGGRWIGNAFHYNTAVVRVNTTTIRNVYVDRTVINNVNNVTINRVSYNGGPRGTAVRPTPADVSVTHETHLPMTPAQTQHVRYAAADREQLSSVNHGVPPVVAVAHPFTAATRPAATPVQAQDRAAAAAKTVARPAAAYVAPERAPETVTHPAAPVDHGAPARPSYAEPRPVTPPQAARPVAPAVEHPAPAPAAPRPQYVAPAQPREAVPAQPRPAAPAQPHYAAPPQQHAAPAQPHAAAPRPRPPAQHPAPEHPQPADDQKH